MCSFDSLLKFDKNDKDSLLPYKELLFCQKAIGSLNLLLLYDKSSLKRYGSLQYDIF